MVKRSQCTCICHTDHYSTGIHDTTIQHCIPCCEPDDNLMTPDDEKPMNNNPTDLLDKIDEAISRYGITGVSRIRLRSEVVELCEQHYEIKVREAIEAMPRKVEMRSEYSRGYADGATDAKGNALKSIAEVFK